MTIRYPASDELRRKSTGELHAIFRDAVQVAACSNVTAAESDAARHTAEAIRLILMQRARLCSLVP